MTGWILLGLAIWVSISVVGSLLLARVIADADAEARHDAQESRDRIMPVQPQRRDRVRRAPRIAGVTIPPTPSCPPGQCRKPE